MQKRKTEETEGERKITREAEEGGDKIVLRQTDQGGIKKEGVGKRKKEKTAFLSQPGGECQLCLSDL